MHMLLFIFYTSNLFFIPFLLPSFILVEYYYISLQPHFDSLILYLCFVSGCSVKYASLTYHSLSPNNIIRLCVELRTFKLQSSIPSFILHTVAVIHFNNNLIQGFVPQALYQVSLPYTVYVNASFNTLTNSLELSHFKMFANMIFMKWLFTFIMIVLLCISQIKFLRLSIFSLFIGLCIFFFSMECCYILYIFPLSCLSFSC